jgi:hypothetical protein
MKKAFLILSLVFPFGVFAGGEAVKDTISKPDAAVVTEQNEKEKNLEASTDVAKDSANKPQAAAESSFIKFDGLTCLPGMVGIKARFGFLKKEHKYCMDVYEFPNTLGKFPLTQVSWGQARAYCNDHGKRLCSDKEWMAACQGPNSLKYPYGAKYEKEKCATEAKYFIKVSSKENCASAYGVYDMTGNVSEWTAGGGVVTFGGAWDDGKSATCKNWTARAIDQKENSIGFRCCLDAK